MAQGRKTGGRQKGIPKTGGRVAGVPNKAKELRVAAMAQAVIDRELSEDDIAMITPLDALLYVMRRRLIAHDWPGAIQAAACAAPYMHARLSVSDIRMHHAVTTRSDEEIEAERAALLVKRQALGRITDVQPEGEPASSETPTANRRGSKFEPVQATEARRILAWQNIDDVTR